MTGHGVTCMCPMPTSGERQALLSQTPVRTNSVCVKMT